jgi:hypothetical protein
LPNLGCFEAHLCIFKSWETDKLKKKTVKKYMEIVFLIFKNTSS